MKQTWPVQKPSKDCFCWWKEREQFCLVAFSFQLKEILPQVFPPSFTSLLHPNRGQMAVNQEAWLTDLSNTVGTKSYPIPSTSYIVLSVSFSSSGVARMEPSGSTPIIWRSSFHFGYHDTLLLRTRLFTHERWPHYSCWCHTGCTHRQANSNLVSYSFHPGNTHLPCEEKAVLLLAPWQPILSPWAVDTKWEAPLVLHGFCLVSPRQDCPHSRVRHCYSQYIFCQL